MDVQDVVHRKTRNALVLFGSETGTAQDAAEEISRMLMRLHFATQVLEFNEIEPSTMSKFSIVICTISTTGQGELPANSKTFWKRILRANLTTSFLESLKIAVFGFGDSSYPKYNYAALKLQKRFSQLGAVSIMAMGKGDEQHPEGHESTFLPWLIELEQQIARIIPLPAGKFKIPEDVLLQPSWLLALGPGRSNVASSTYSGGQAPVAVTRSSNQLESRDLEVILQQNDRTTAKSHWQDVRHIVMTCNSRVNYVPGDILVIYPHNSKEHVQDLIDLMRWQDVADQSLVFSKNSQALQSLDERQPSFQGSSSSPVNTLRGLLEEHLDINSIPRRSFFSFISHFTGDEYQKNRLLELSNTEYSDELFDYATKTRRTILEVLQEFHTVKLPWQWAAVVFPALRGRQFSIASGGKLMSGEEAATRFDLLVAIVKYKTTMWKVRRGVCSRYLEGLSNGTKMMVSLQRGGLGISAKELARPIVLIGPGTGIAPIRSLLWQRLAWIAQHPDIIPGRHVLFFGCRNQNADYHFQDEWEILKSLMPLDVYTAFSREDRKGEPKQYVQDIIRQNRKTVSSMLCKGNGIVFVCGSSGKMPVGVRLAIKDAIIMESAMTEPEAEAFMVTLEKTNRYKQETW